MMDDEAGWGEMWFVGRLLTAGWNPAARAVGCGDLPTTHPVLITKASFTLGFNRAAHWA